MEKRNLKIIPGAGPFYYNGSEIGVMMFPGGGGGTCADLKPLAEDLNSLENYTVHVPLLTGFGTSPKDLHDTSILEWKEALKEELELIKSKCKKVIIGGHSLGGIFSLILASKYKVDGIFTIGAPIGIPGIAPKLIPLIRLFIKYYPVNSQKLREETSGKWVGYDKIPLNMVPKVKKLIKEVKSSLAKIECPALLFQGRLDSQIKNKSMDYIYENINSKEKKKIWLENSEHPILDIPDHEQIVSQLINFIKKF
ncbi:MAG: alpha/beta hydrolase [Candidatus Hodarchaeota archaeon]